MTRDDRRRERRGAAALVVLVLAVITVGAAVGGGAPDPGPAAGPAGPRRPASEDEVLARVPARAADGVRGTRERLARRLAEDAGDVDAAVELARLHVLAARRDGDPRLLGRAQGVLGAWWDDPRPPPEVLLLRATIRQSRHEFDVALADLERLAAVVPGDPQVWLTRSVVLGVLGRYQDGLDGCTRLEGLASSLVMAACRAPLDGVLGRARPAAAALGAAMGAARSPGERAWALSLLGDLARWRGDEPAAEDRFREALAADAGDGYARTALADLLLDGDRPGEAAALVAGRDSDDAMLLRRALAEHAAGAAGDAGPGGGAVTAMRARLAASRARGDAVHAREEARFVLAVDGDAPRALALATDNWRVQREPADARVLLEAALAAGDRAAAAPVLAWLGATGFEWPRLRRLAAALQWERS
jgi:tetratricopeptide (TPR) repeat protein